MQENYDVLATSQTEDILFSAKTITSNNMASRVISDQMYPKAEGGSVNFY